MEACIQLGAAPVVQIASGPSENPAKPASSNGTPFSDTLEGFLENPGNTPKTAGEQTGDPKSTSGTNANTHEKNKDKDAELLAALNTGILLSGTITVPIPPTESETSTGPATVPSISQSAIKLPISAPKPGNVQTAENSLGTLLPSAGQAHVLSADTPPVPQARQKTENASSAQHKTFVPPLPSEEIAKALSPGDAQPPPVVKGTEETKEIENGKTIAPSNGASATATSVLPLKEGTAKPQSFVQAALDAPHNNTPVPVPDANSAPVSQALKLAMESSAVSPSALPAETLSANHATPETREQASTILPSSATNAFKPPRFINQDGPTTRTAIKLSLPVGASLAPESNGQKNIEPAKPVASHSTTNTPVHESKETDSSAAGTNSPRPEPSGTSSTAPSVVSTTHHNENVAGSVVVPLNSTGTNNGGTLAPMPSEKMPATPMPAPTSSPEPKAAMGDIQAARIVDHMGQTEMHIDLRSPTFGSIEVHTVVRESQVGLSVGSEKGDLRSFLGPELPALQSALHQHDLHFDAIRFLGQSASLDAGFSGNPHSGSHFFRQPSHSTPAARQSFESPAAQESNDPDLMPRPLAGLNLHA